MDRSGKLKDGFTRKELLESGATAAAAALLAQGAGSGVERALAASKGKRRDVAGMNIVLFLTDQERAIQHFPPNWLRRNLPGMRRLRRHGLSFERAFTNACMCSPARSTLMSGYFPAQHGVKYTLEEDMPASEYPQVELPVELKNLATVMKAAGYNVVYKGKWHCSKPAGKEAVPADLEKYGFQRWDPPDAGANQSVPEAGGGKVNNDGRFMESVGEPAAGTEGALQYLGSTAAQQQPFFMVISLVNPHDVLFYPGSGFEEDEYDQSWLEGNIHLPETVSEDLSTKPSVQEQFLRIFNLSGKLETPQQKRDYLNFYGNLMRSSDNYLVNVLDKLEETGLFDNTLVVRTADHGEMGVAHGGLRQKNFNVYEESLRVPLVYSNPTLFPSRPKPTRSSHMWTSCRHWRAWPPRRSRPGRTGRESITPRRPAPLLREVRTGLRRLHLRRLPVRTVTRPLPQAAQPHSQHPRRALEAGQVPRRRTPQTAAVGDVRPEDGPAGEDEPRLQRLRALTRAGEAVPAAQTKARPGREDPPAASLAAQISDLGADRDGPLVGQLEVLDRARGVARHRDEQQPAPAAHAGDRGRHDRNLRENVDGPLDVDVALEPAVGGQRERAGNVRGVLEAEARGQVADAVVLVAEVVDDQALGLRHVRRFGRLDREDHHGLAQRPDVLDARPQRQRRRFPAGVQVDRRARHPCQRRIHRAQLVHEVPQRPSSSRRAARTFSLPQLPGAEDGEDRDADREREPAAVRDLGQVGARGRRGRR